MLTDVPIGAWIESPAPSGWAPALGAAGGAGERVKLRPLPPADGPFG
jgi:hypothetical protein